MIISIKKSPNQIAIIGTICVWILLLISFSFYSLLPQKKVYKTVQIRLDAPVAAEKSTFRESAPPKLENTNNIIEQKLESSSSTSKKSEATTKASSVQKKQQQAKAKPTVTPKKEQVLQKSVDELMSEQLNAQKKKTAKEFDWSQFDDIESVDSSSVSSNNTSVNRVNTFEGSAASASQGTNSQTVTSSNSNNENVAVSDSTSNRLSIIQSTSYSQNAGNGVTSSATIQTTSSNGKVSLAMRDGTIRQLLEPSMPIIELSEAAAATVDGSTAPFKITFVVNADGRVPVNGIRIPSSIVSSIVRQEIASQISKWRFQSASTDSQAIFEYKIIKQ